MTEAIITFFEVGKDVGGPKIGEQTTSIYGSKQPHISEESPWVLYGRGPVHIGPGILAVHQHDDADGPVLIIGLECGTVEVPINTTRELIVRDRFAVINHLGVNK
jgi:hypothetical protein